MTTVEIFSQGEEVVTGLTVDSNAAWLSQQLVQMGFTVTRHTAVGDNLHDLTALLREIAGRADCCICTGGLGPTVDDLTAEAVAEAFDLPLQFDRQAYQQIAAFFQQRNRPMPESNRKQAMLPQGAVRLDNHWGTAPGFALQYQRCWFAFVPGVPYEMRCLFNHKIRPILQQNHQLKPTKLVTIRSFGIGESDIQQRIQSIVLPERVQLSFCAGSDDVQTKLIFAAEYRDRQIQTLTETVANRIGDYVFAIDGINRSNGDLAQVVAAMLQNNRQSLAVIETISHGMLSAKFLPYRCLVEALFVQSLQTLYARLGLDYAAEPQLDRAVAVAKAMQQQSRAGYVLVQLVDDDPDAIANENGSVTLHNVLATEHEMLQKTVRVSGPLTRKQNQAALSALDLLRRYLQNKAI